jgi:phosphate starvation-inducible PhoH-like protein
MIKITLNLKDNEQLANITGSFDEYLKRLEQSFSVQINNHGEDFKITGKYSEQAKIVLEQLTLLSNDKKIELNDVELLINQVTNKTIATNNVNIRTRRKTIQINSKNQQKYVKAVDEKDCVFAIGPAGTGKTYLAVAKAVEALETSQINRIVLVRPAVEAGEKLGFLPGDLAEKVDPYLRPVYDALYEMLGYEKVNKLLEKNKIEVAPLAFMRGRTLNESFVILDEAQNTTKEQMKMFLTRLGFGSQMIITGDVTQIDLAQPQQSGLIHAIDILKSIKQVEFIYFNSNDVVRHNLVKRIVLAYEQA